MLSVLIQDHFPPGWTYSKAGNISLLLQILVSFRSCFCVSEQARMMQYYIKGVGSQKIFKADFLDR